MTTDPTVHRNLDVQVGSRPLTTLTREQLDDWVSRMQFADGGPFMVVARAGEPAFIQTYRNGANDFDLEWHEGPPHKEFRRTSVDDESVVATLMWAWLEGDTATLEESEWETASL